MNTCCLQAGRCEKPRREPEALPVVVKTTNQIMHAPEKQYNAARPLTIYSSFKPYRFSPEGTQADQVLDP